MQNGRCFALALVAVCSSAAIAHLEELADDKYWHLGVADQLGRLH